MKLDNFVPFGRPQSGTVIIQLMAELDVSNTAIPNPFRKQSNAPSFTSKMRCRNSHFWKIYNQQ